MPPGMDDYDVVIGVSVDDNTALGSASVKKSVHKMSDDIRQYGDRQAREFSRNSQTIFQQTNQNVTRSADTMVKRLVYVFDQNNFLLRNLARSAGSTTAAIGIGVGKLALSYGKLGKDTEAASYRAKVAVQDIQSAVGRLGTDPSAFPTAIKATRELSAAYELMGKSGHAASIKAGSALEDAVHKRLVTLQGGLLKAQTGFEKLRINASRDADLLRNKVNEISASVQRLLQSGPVDSTFFKSFIKARTESEKFLIVNDKLGARAAVTYSAHQKEIEKLAGAFARLESRATRTSKTQVDKMSIASSAVRKYTADIAGVEKALVGATGGTEALTLATGGMSSSMLVGSVAVGAVLAVVLLLVVAAAALTVIMYKGATTAAAYGDEIYKLSLSTGLSVKTLSALSIIAKETNTEVDSLAKTFTRTQIQVQRGLDKPFSEAGRALRTLKVDFAELRKANPDQQVFMLAKAFTELNNQNVRATVSQQLFSRDAERQAKMLEQVATGFTIAQAKAKKYGLELDESGAVKAHAITVAVKDLSLAWQGLWVTLGIKILPPLTILMEKFTESVVSTSGAFHFLGEMSSTVLHEIRLQIEIIKEINALGPGGMVLMTGFSGKSARERAQVTLDREDAQQKADYDKRIEELKRRGLQGDDQYAAGKGPRTPADRLEDQVKRLRFEIQALQDIGSKNFKLRFELEDLQKVKSGFEDIFKLRFKMGLTLDSPVPQFRVFGTSEEQAQDIANIQSYVHQLERMKDVFEGVRKVANEQSDAIGDLARVQQEALMPVVDAGTLAEIKYHTAIRNRAKAEKELTADVLAESKLRKEAIEDEVGNTLRAYMTLQRDLGRSQDTVREQRAQDELFVKILRGGADAEQALRASLEERMGSTATPGVPTELMAIAAHAATIDLNVASIAERMGANVHNASNTNITSPASSTGYATSSLVRRNPDGTVTVVAQQNLNGDDDVIKTQTTDPGFIRQRILNESRERVGAERSAAVRKANQDIIDSEMRMNQELIDLDTDYLSQYKVQQNLRRVEARATTVSIMLLENDLIALSNQNSELYKRTWAEADEARLNSHKRLKEEIIQLQNDITNNGFDMSDRLTKARLQGIRDIQEASNEARESIVYNQQIIADQTIYHAEIADAKVMEFLAHQRSITEIIADAKVGVIDTTFSAIDRGLEKVTSKLGMAGDLVKDLLSGFIRLALSPFFKAMYGGSGGGLPGIFGGGGGGGGSLPGMGPGGTPVFNPSSLMSALSPGAGASANIPGSTGGAFGGTGSLLSGGAGLQGLLSGGASRTGSLLGGLRTGFGAIAPMLGLSLGMQAGGSSRFGSILGGAGGLIAGGMGAAALLGTTTGIFAAGGSLASLAPFLTNPFTAVLAGGLLVGALILRRNAARREEETKRNVVSQDTGTRLWQMVELVKTDQMDGAAANAEIEELHAKWIEFGNTLKDSKTRRHHMETWNHFAPIIDLIRRAAEGQTQRANIRNRMIPVFGGGGWSAENQLIKARPGEGIQYPGSNVVHTIFGRDRGYDTEFMYVPKGTKILNRQEMTSAIPMLTGGTAGMNSSSNDLPELHIDKMEVNFTSDGLADIVISSPHFKKAVIHSVKIAKKEKKIA